MEEEERLDVWNQVQLKYWMVRRAKVCRKQNQIVWLKRFISKCSATLPRIAMYRASIERAKKSQNLLTGPWGSESHSRAEKDEGDAPLKEDHSRRRVKKRSIGVMSSSGRTRFYRITKKTRVTRGRLAGKAKEALEMVTSKNFKKYNLFIRGRQKSIFGNSIFTGRSIEFFRKWTNNTIKRWETISCLR